MDYIKVKTDQTYQTCLVNFPPNKARIWEPLDPIDS